MGNASDIADAAASDIGDSDVLGMISAGMRRNERVEIKRTGVVPKARAVSRWEVEHDLESHLWCGLSAVSCLTGYPTSYVRDTIRAYRGDDTARIQGTLDAEIKTTFEAMGFECNLVYFCYAPIYNEAPTMARWLREFDRQPHVGYLIGQRGVGRKSGHWCVAHGDFYCCSLTHGNWLPIEKAPGRRQRIVSAYAITKQS